jgi:hypothetical protein
VEGTKLPEPDALVALERDAAAAALAYGHCACAALAANAKLARRSNFFIDFSLLPAKNPCPRNVKSTSIFAETQSYEE